MSSEKFESWAIVELFGHQVIAGKVSEASIGGCSFVRVDVPHASDANAWAYTRFFGNGAIYAINPTTEEVARIRARGGSPPAFAYDVNHEIIENAIKNRLERLAPPSDQKTIFERAWPPAPDEPSIDDEGDQDDDDDHDAGDEFPM